MIDNYERALRLHQYLEEIEGITMDSSNLLNKESDLLTEEAARSMTAYAVAAQALAAALAVPGWVEEVEAGGNGTVWTAGVPPTPAYRSGSEWEQDAEVPR